MNLGNLTGLPVNFLISSQISVAGGWLQPRQPAIWPNSHRRVQNLKLLHIIGFRKSVAKC